MELLTETIHTAPRDAATVVMLRDAPTGLEVFLVKRHGLSDVLGGAYVFPGGKLDAEDALLDSSAHLDQDTPQLHSALGEADTAPEVAKGLFVAALREAFEESGVLYAHGATQSHSQQALQLLKNGRSFNQVLADMGLRLHTRSILPWSRWITPRKASVSTKRFDTRFFVAAIPNDQIAQHDNFEATESVWLSPRAALTQYWNREIELAPPQIMSLAHLARHASVHSVLEQARQTPPPLVEPEPFDREAERVLTYPGDSHHSVQARALPGPTRLVYRNRRFEPESGFEGLFA